MNITVARLGRVDYQEALVIQEKLHSLRIQNKIGDILLLLEHYPVLTLGKRGQRSNIIAPQHVLEANNVKIYDINRGGDVTYHGPGQIVGYPIMDLDKQGKDIKDFVWKIEEVFLRLLKEEFNITAHREDKKYTGVWVNVEKITAIGIAVELWVTMHGFAFNVNTQLEHFKWINPCGITGRGVTSLERILGQKQDFDRLNQLIITFFCEVFSLEPEIIEKKALYQMTEIVKS